MAFPERQDVGARRPVGDVLGGLLIHPLADGDVAEEAFILVKTRGAGGITSWGYRTTRTPNKEEILGALLVQTDLLRRELVQEWE